MNIDLQLFNMIVSVLKKESLAPKCLLELLVTMGFERNKIRIATAEMWDNGWIDLGVDRKWYMRKRFKNDII